MKNFLNKMWTSDGRRNRVQLLQGYLVILTCYLIIALIIGSLQAIIPQIGLLFFLVFPLIISGWFISVQRLHDCGQTGYWMLLKFVPFINLCLILYILFMPGNTHPNKYDFVKDGGMTKDL